MTKMTRAQMKLAKMAYGVRDGKIPFSEYREAEKRHNAALWGNQK